MLRAAGPTSRSTSWGRWGECLADEGCQSLAGCCTVAPLGTVLGGLDRQDGPVEPSGQACEEAFALLGREAGRGGDVQRELDSGVGGVDALTARARGTREPFGEVRGADDLPTRQARSGRDAQVLLHTTEYAAGARGQGVT